jgi:hypothetical protein
MLVNFKKPKAGILNVPVPIDKKIKALSPEKRAHHTPKIVSLVPGINEIPDVRWNKIKDNERIVLYRSRGWIVLPYAEIAKIKKNGPKNEDGTLGKEITVEKELTLKEFKSLTVKEQEALIEETELVSILKKWKKSGAKEATMSFLIDRINRLEHPEKYVDDDDVEV